MSGQIVFPCPNCGASQSVDDATVSTQCQFCGNTIAVPENLRPKPTTPDPAQAIPQSFSFGGATGIPALGGLAGLSALPSLFQNMDIGKLQAMAMAARSGDTAEAARLYSETFGVTQEEAMQAAQLMASHHHVVLSQMQFGPSMARMDSSSPVIQIGGVPQPLPTPRPSATYNLPSPPVVGRSRGFRWGSCLMTVFILAIGIIILGVIVFTTLRIR